MKRKLKECSGCKKLTYLWKSNPPLCRDCYYRDNVKPLNSKKRKPISPVSPKMADKLKKYRTARDKYFKENPVCEFPGCNSREVTLHHKRGRIGSFLIDKRYFCSLCHKHHMYVHENDAEARAMGLLGSRTAND